MMDRPLFEKYLKRLQPLPTGQKQQGGLEPPLSCLICDLYGTLFISGSGDISASTSAGGSSTALKDLLAEYGIPMPPREILSNLRQAIRQAHDRARKKGVVHPEIRIEKIWRSILPLKDMRRIRKFATAFELIVNPVWPMPHALALIRACRKAGIILGVISNAQFFTEYLFPWFFRLPASRLGFDPRLIFYSFRHGEAKPSLNLFQPAVERLGQMGIPPRRVAYIGNDMRKDILPAGSSGFQTILFAGDRRSLRLRRDDPDCARLHADLVISNLKQLISLLAAVDNAGI
ncbi:MAG: HAD family hydrolase [Desulfosarcinaceae bacterium]